jgi:hypothetical protein
VRQQVECDFESNADYDAGDEDSWPWKPKYPRAIWVQWVIGSRDGLQRLWVFRGEKVYEIGDSHWQETGRAEFAERWNSSVRVFFVSYARVGLAPAPSVPLPLRILRGATDRPWLDVLAAQADFEVPYRSLSLEWAIAFFKQSLFFPSFYIKHCDVSLKTEIAFAKSIGQLPGVDWDNNVLRVYAGFAAYASFNWCAFVFVQFLEELCKSRWDLMAAHKNFAWVMGSLPTQSNLVVRFILSLALEMAGPLADESAGEFANTIRQGLAMALGADYLRKLRLGEARSRPTPDDVRWAGDNPEYKFLSPEPTIGDEDCVTPRELAVRLDDVLAKGTIHGKETGVSLSALIRRFDVERDRNGEPVPLPLTDAYMEYVGRYRATVACRP